MASTWARMAFPIVKKISRNPSGWNVPIATDTSAGRCCRLAKIITSTRRAHGAQSVAIRSAMERKCICRVVQYGIHDVGQARHRNRRYWTEWKPMGSTPRPSSIELALVQWVKFRYVPRGREHRGEAFSFASFVKFDASYLLHSHNFFDY